MAWIHLNQDRKNSWYLDTQLDGDGELELWHEDGAARSVWLDPAKLRRLRDIIDNAISQCPCDYATAQRLCDEFPEYHLGAIDPECPFHGEKLADV